MSPLGNPLRAAGGLESNSEQRLRREEKYRGISNRFVNVRRRSFLFDIDVVVCCGGFRREYSGGHIVSSKYSYCVA